jgi:hypothetical protein
MFTDITKPDPDRFRKQLSGLINFYKYREDQEEDMAVFLQEIDAQRSANDKLNHENAELISQIKAAR